VYGGYRLPTAVLAAVMFVSDMPPVILCALACAIEVRGVIWTPLMVEPAVTEGMTLVITSPVCMDMLVLVASFVYVPPLTISMTDPE
jgi:hypothetical protein